MSLLWNKRVADTSAIEQLIRDRGGARKAGSVTVNQANALTHSAVWAALRLRANLVSSMPVDQYRRTAGVQQEVPKSQLVASPGAIFVGGSRVSTREWMYATQMDLDRAGNCFGLIDYVGSYPDRVDLTPVEAWSVSVRQGKVQYRYDGKIIDPLRVWHERQYVLPGLPVGLSPVAYSAMAIGQYLSAQQFALDWFAGGGVPNARLKNTAKKIDSKESQLVKRRWRDSVRAGEPVVLGADWEYDMISAVASQSEFLTTQKFSIADVSRFFDVPGDMIDAETSTGSVTYANITQRNLQLMVTSLGPAVGRREEAFTRALPAQQFVKLNTDSVLRMDPKTRYEMLAIGVAQRAITPNEWRELDDRQPLTPEQESEFARLFPTRQADPVQAKSEPVQLTVNGAPVDVDARSYPSTTVPEREVRIENNVDATTALLEGSVQVTNEVDARSTTTVPEREVRVQVDSPVTVEAPEQRATRKTVETDDRGRITAIVEERQ